MRRRGPSTWGLPSWWDPWLSAGHLPKGTPSEASQPAQVPLLVPQPGWPCHCSWGGSGMGKSLHLQGAPKCRAGRLSGSLLFIREQCGWVPLYKGCKQPRAEGRITSTRMVVSMRRKNEIIGEEGRRMTVSRISLFPGKFCPLAGMDAVRSTNSRGIRRPDREKP